MTVEGLFAAMTGPPMPWQNSPPGYCTSLCPSLEGFGGVGRCVVAVPPDAVELVRFHAHHQRARRMQGFKSPGHAQRFLSASGPITQHVRPRRQPRSASTDRHVMIQRSRAGTKSRERRQRQGTDADQWHPFLPGEGLNLQSVDNTIVWPVEKAGAGNPLAGLCDGELTTVRGRIG